MVMAVLATLVTIASPHYLGGLQKSRVAVLKANLETAREAIDKYFADKGEYPESIEALVIFGYLRKIPYDPIAEQYYWKPVKPEHSDGISDLHSASDERARDGSLYASW